MMDFITIPLTTGIIFVTIYGLFELIVRRKERMFIIEKLSDKLDRSYLDGRILPFNLRLGGFSFSALKIGCLLCGIGLGLLTGFILETIVSSHQSEMQIQNMYRFLSAAYGSCCLLFGGLGLIIAFVIETKMNNKK